MSFKSLRIFNEFQKVCILLGALYFINFSLLSQTNIILDEIEVYGADELIYIIETEGVDKLYDYVSPAEFVLMDTSYLPKIVDIEFQSGFYDFHHDNNDVHIYDFPELTIDLADFFDSPYIQKKLLSYYLGLPKVSRSDTIYTIYNYDNLSDLLRILIKHKSPFLVQQLEKDYNEWIQIAQNALEKTYLTLEEESGIPFEERNRFKPNDLIVDCKYIALQIASSLNYLDVNGFEDSVINDLRSKQISQKEAEYYEFIGPSSPIFDSKSSYLKRITDSNSLGIKDFGEDIEKVEKLIFQTVVNSYNSDIYSIINNGKSALVYVSRFNGSDDYLLRLNPDSSITIDHISSTIQ